MSWSLTLSPRLSPAVLLGVSKETFRSSSMSRVMTLPSKHAISGLNFAATRIFPEQLSVPCGAHLALGVTTQFKELPITAA